MPISYNPTFQPSIEDEPGPSFDMRAFGGLKNMRPLREAKRQPDFEIYFDDTNKLMQVNRDRKILREAEAHLNEHVSPNEDSFNGLGAHAEPTQKSQGHFQRGVPTNDASSSKNYKPDHTRIIKGEHVSLLKNGALTEALDDDDHDAHILEHRYMLSNENLTETMRSALMEHIAMHAKMKKKGLKQTQEDTAERAKRRFGPGVASRMAGRANGGSDSKIPQWGGQDLERQRTAGTFSMESGSKGRGSKARFSNALKVRSGRGL